MHEKGQAAMMEPTFLTVGTRCINVSNIGWTEAGGDPDKRWIDLIFSNHQKLRLENQDAEQFMHLLDGHGRKLEERGRSVCPTLRKSRGRQAQASTATARATRA